ncbi:MAG: hypothetical protein GF334_02630 [Candidatus Altiarchaeales archaeon]|nr:hypothetical protein [Candidatus Altiarchaeales archaeon]
MDEWTEKKLIEALIEKHDRLIQEYSDSMESQKRLSILREKKDQLEYWVDEEAEDKYKKELIDTQKELETLEENLIATDLRPSELKSRIDEHVSAKKYWTQKLQQQDG